MNAEQRERTLKEFCDNCEAECEKHGTICRRKTVVREHFCPNCGVKVDGGDEA